MVRPTTLWVGHGPADPSISVPPRPRFSRRGYRRNKKYSGTTVVSLWPLPLSLPRWVTILVDDSWLFLSSLTNKRVLSLLIAADGSERCCLSGRRCWQVSTHHSSSSWCASLAASAPADPLQGGRNCFWLCPRHRPTYFRDVCVPVADISGRAHLCSAERCDMLVPRTRTQFGQRSFHLAAPVVWNSLPTHLCLTSVSREQFRDGLKTHLFTQAYAFYWELFV